MTNAQIEHAMTQAKNIEDMMDGETAKMFNELDADNQFKFICAALAVTASD